MLQKKHKTVVLLVLAVVGIISLGSCLDISTEIKMSRNGRVKATIEYSLDSSVADFGRGFGSDDQWPFPLSEVDFRQKALKTDGVELLRYRVKSGNEGDSGDVVTAIVEAESLDALSSYLDMPMVMSGDSKSGEISFTFPVSGEYASASDDSRAVIDTLVADSHLRIIVRPPGKPLDGGVGIIDGRSASLEIPLLDYLYGRAPDSWVISW